MATQPRTISAPSRQIWLRRSDPANPDPPGMWRDMALSVIGNAAARETFVAATPHMAAIWTDLFQSMITPDPKLRWRGDGPGIGRDARIAYSSLLGRYIARAYLTEDEGVRVLVPLDVAKRQFKGTDYRIGKNPRGKGLEADWIGIDGSGLVIVEAKGTFDKGIKTWHKPGFQPQILGTAIAQAERTAVFVRSSGRKLPAKRWAIASRWGTEDKYRDPTLLAWGTEEDKLVEGDYQALAKILLRADLDGVMWGLGHSESETAPDVAEPPELNQRYLQSLFSDLDLEDLEPGFVAIVGPFGVQPLPAENDLLQMLQTRNWNLNIAVASLSFQYVKTVTQEQPWLDDVVPIAARPTHRNGLTVVWLKSGEAVDLREE